MKDSDIYLERVFSYHRPLVLFPGLLCSAIGLTILGAAAFSLAPQHALMEEGLKTVAAIAVGMVLLGGGVAMLILYARRQTNMLRIDRAGIGYGKERFRWSDVQRVQGECCLGGIQLVVKINGRLSPLPMTVDPGLTEREFHNLQARVSPDQPHVRWRIVTPT